MWKNTLFICAIVMTNIQMHSIESETNWSTYIWANSYNEKMDLQGYRQAIHSFYQKKSFIALGESALWSTAFLMSYFVPKYEGLWLYGKCGTQIITALFAGLSAVIALQKYYKGKQVHNMPINEELATQYNRNETAPYTIGYIATHAEIDISPSERICILKHLEAHNLIIPTYVPHALVESAGTAVPLFRPKVSILEDE